MENLFQFGHAYMLWVLLIIPLLAFLLVWSMRRRRKNLILFGGAKHIDHLTPGASVSAHWWKGVFLLLGVALIIIGAAGPRVGSKLKEVEQKGREVIIALDVSNSMLAEDVKPSRIVRAKQLISRMVDDMNNDKIGLIVFAGDAYTQIPITDDYPSVKMFLSTTGPDMVSRQGTAIGAAIDLAMRSFPTPETDPESDQVLKNRAIVVITDGENHEDDAIAAAKTAGEAGIRVFTVGIGDPKGVPIPVSPGSRSKKRAKDGSVVVSKLNEKLLVDIARAADGGYFPLSRDSELMKELDALEQSDIKKTVYADFAERYQYFLGLGMLFLLLELLILVRKNPLLQKMNLFISENGK